MTDVQEIRDGQRLCADCGNAFPTPDELEDKAIIGLEWPLGAIQCLDCWFNRMADWAEREAAKNDDQG